MNKLTIMFAALSLALCGCSKKEEQNQIDLTQNVVHIDIAAAHPMSEVLTPKQLINFSEECENIMGFARNIFVRGDTIYAISLYPSAGIFAYLKSGEQLFSYCSQGAGPEDINSPSCISVTDSEISTYDDSSFKLVKIDKLGNFLEAINTPAMTLNALWDKEGNQWFDFTNQQYEDIRVSWRQNNDTAIQTVMEVPELQKGITIIGIEALQNLPDGTVGYTPVMEPRLYTLSDGKASVRYELDFNGLWPDDKTFKEKFTGNAWAPNSSKFPVQQLRFHENDKYLIINFKSEKQPYIHILDKLSGKEKTLLLDPDTYINTCYIDESDLYLTRKDDQMEIMSIEKFDF
ncbi:MAG: 6-bladed beta-propeller [Muribaculaceae bacterium]|nr:6-bladed beta-propeller [Muribaculaceae bacterium]